MLKWFQKVGSVCMSSQAEHISSEMATILLMTLLTLAIAPCVLSQELIRANVGDLANLTLVGDVDFSDISWILYRDGVLVLDYTDPTAQIYAPGYDGRVSWSFVDPTSMRVTINVSATDHGTYKTSNGPGQSVLFIFSEPTTPSLTQDPNPAQLGGNVSISCDSSATSLPAGYRQTLTYSYTLNGTSLTDQSFTVTSSTLQVGCSVTELDNRNSASITSDLVWSPSKATLTVSPTANPKYSGLPMTLTCTSSPSGNPLASQYNLFKDGQLRRSQLIPKYVVTTVNVPVYDGMWSCAAVNTGGAGESSESVEVIVYQRPKIRQDFPRTYQHYQSDLSQFNVYVTFESKPGSIVICYQNSSTALGGVSSISVNESTVSSGKLNVTTVSLAWKPTSTVEQRRAARGNYHCSATLPSDNTASNSVEMSLEVAYGPISIDVTSKDQPAERTVIQEQGTSFNRSCVADCYPLCSYQWTHNDNDGTEKLVSPSNSLIINILQKAASGVYTCRANNSYDQPMVTSFSLDVQYAPMDMTLTRNQSDPVIEGDTFELTCEVDSNPTARIQIFNALDGTEYPPITPMENTNRLSYTVESAPCVTLYFGCRATKNNNVLTRTLTPIDVECMPQVYNMSENPLTKIKGESAEMFANILANPFPKLEEIFWTFVPHNEDGDSEPPDLPDFFITGNKIRLIISDTEEEDFGNYMLTVSNKHGDTAVVFQLVRGPDPLKVGMIAGLTVAGVLLLVLVIVIVVCYRMGRKQPEHPNTRVKRMTKRFVSAIDVIKRRSQYPSNPNNDYTRGPGGGSITDGVQMDPIPQENPGEQAEDPLYGNQELTVGADTQPIYGNTGNAQEDVTHVLYMNRAELQQGQEHPNDQVPVSGDGGYLKTTGGAASHGATDMEPYTTLSRPNSRKQLQTMMPRCAREFQPGDILIDEIYKEGTMYDIYHAIAGNKTMKKTLPTDILVKKLKVPETDHAYWKYIKSEADCLARLHSMDETVNVVKCLGYQNSIHRDPGVKFIVLENVGTFTLQDRLLQIQSYTNTRPEEYLCDLNLYTQQITSALCFIAYLAVESGDSPVVHYGLSTSSVLLSESQQCKVHGFASLKAVQERETYEAANKISRCKRFLAPEVIQHKRVPESDLWSMGLLLWQIFNLGTTPFDDQDTSNITAFFVGMWSGQLSQPAHCEPKTFEIMKSCWNKDPLKRVTFHETWTHVDELCRYMNQPIPSKSAARL